MLIWVCLENTIQFIVSIIFVSTLIFVIDQINFGSKTFKATLYCYDKLLGHAWSHHAHDDSNNNVKR